MTSKPNITRMKVLFLAATLALSPTLAQQVVADGGGTYSGYDTNQDGYLDRNEFQPFAATRQKRSSSPQLWDFNSMDTDDDSRISEQEMVNTLMEELKRKQLQNP